MPYRLYENPIYDQEVDITSPDDIYLIIDNENYEKPKKVPLSFILAQASVDTILGDEQLSGTGWTSAGWTGNWTDGWTHNTGNTSVLSNSMSAIIDNSYLITFTVSGRTAGNFTVAFGGVTSGAQTASNSFTIKATTTGNLQITPTTDFDGTILISVKQVAWELTKEQILELLEITESKWNEIKAIDTSLYVEKEAGKGLSSNDYTDEEKAKLDLLNQNVYEITLNASSDVATRLSGLIEVINYPAGWVLAADSAVNLLITHTLTGRKIVDVKVWEIDGENETLAKPFSDGYEQIVANGMTVKIVGLDTLAVALRIELIFN